jgi:hypothetical protein
MRSLVDSQREVSDSQRSLDMLSEPSGPMRRSLDDGDGAGAEGSGRSATPLQMFCQSFSIDTGIKEVSPEMVRRPSLSPVPIHPALKETKSLRAADMWYSSP